MAAGRPSAPVRWPSITKRSAGRSADSPGVKADLRRVDEKLHGALPGARIASYASTGDRAFVSKDGRTTFTIVIPCATDGSN